MPGDNRPVTKLNRLAIAAGAASALGALAAAGRGVNTAMGGRPTGDRLERAQRSPAYRAGAFHNTSRGTSSMPSGQRDVLRRFRENAATRHPALPIPVVTATHEPRTEGVHVTWFGHASCLVELDGVRLLMDPVWSERCSPSQHVGPRRLHAVPVPLSGLGRVDAVVISHDHYDHLDMDTIRSSLDLTEAVFLVPLGVGAHLDALGRAGLARRRVRLGGGAAGAGRSGHGRRGAALLGARPAPRRHPVGLVGARRPGRQGVLQWRHRLLRRLRAARRGARPVRRLADGRRRVRPGLARASTSTRRRPSRPPGCCAAAC